MSDDDDDVPQLSEAARIALQEFLQEQSNQNESDIKEDWQLSQFWYDNSTINHLSRSALSSCSDNSKIALISCPSLYKTIRNLQELEKKNVEVKLFEFDKRFSSYSPDFIFYDYNQPLDIDESYKNYFDVILVDPPFLSEECLTKTSKTIEFIRKNESKIILCTGAVMESIAVKLLNVKKCSFEPVHNRNLANSFICLTNFGELG